tara:strand:- start:1799 stop:2197 length:399 start_codon:yes stop_codon:yes gene_type:complete
MKLRNRENFKSNENSMLPLVNIIFLLLIFFMIAGVIQKQKELYEVDLGKATIDKYVEKKINTIFINDDGSLILNDKPIAFGNLSKVVASIKDKSELMIAADKELSAFRLNQVLLVLAKQDIKKILIMTSKND